MTKFSAVLRSCIRGKGKVAREENFFMPIPVTYNVGQADILMIIIFCCSFSIAVRYTTDHFAFCFLIMMAAYSMAAHFCFLSTCIVLLFRAASGDKGEVSRE